MRITMVKKRLANGEPCPKCAQTEDMLRRRGHWDKIDEVVWAVEGQPDAPGWAWARRHDVEVAPFFVIDEDGQESALTSPLRLIKKYFDTPKAAPSDASAPASASASASASAPDVESWARELADASPRQVLEFALARFGDRCAIAFSGGVDVVLLDMAARLGKPFRVFTVDTGRLHEETYAYFDEVRRRYGVELEVFLPDSSDVMDLMSNRGANSFLRDGHVQCCDVRQVRPLARALEGREAWLTGRMAARADGERTPVVEIDPKGSHAEIVRLNPLANWSHEQALAHARKHDVPLNPLLDQGYRLVGCAPCTRPLGPDDPPRAIRWWWEEGTVNEPDAVIGGEGI